jgi:4-phytase/acid phosphatase
MRALGLCLLLALPAPGQESLRYAIIVTRHGVRAPTWEPARLNQTSAQPWPDFGVPPGNLTAHGYALMKLMGGYYGERFKPDCAKTSVQSDTDQRTIETGKALIAGMLPGCKVEVSVVDKRLRADAGKALEALEGRMESAAQEHRAEVELLQRVLGKRVTINLATASTLTENLLLEYTDGMSGDKFAWGRMTPAELERVMSLHTAYAELTRRTPAIAKLSGGDMLRDILQLLQKGALADARASVSVIVGHDTDLSNISGILGLTWKLPSYQRDDAPPGGALVFSLWESRGKLMVRLQFVAQTMAQMHNATPVSLKNPPAVVDVAFPSEWAAFQRAVENALK